MKRTALIFALTLFSATLFAQENIAVFVYSTTKLNEPTNALRSRIVSALYNNAGNRYTVVDRSDEFLEILKKEISYQESGYVSDRELIQAGKQLGADKVCGAVITYYNNEGYFIECKILDVKENHVEGQAEYPRVGKGDIAIQNIGIANSQMVATSLAEQLNMTSIGMKEEAERIKVEQEKKQKKQVKEQRKEYRKYNDSYFRGEKNKYIAWSILGCGYPWTITTGVESRSGKALGIGLYGNVGLNFIPISYTLRDIYDVYYNSIVDNNGECIKTSFSYSGGVKFFLYKGLFFDVGYGTITQMKKDLSITYISDYNYRNSPQYHEKLGTLEADEDFVKSHIESIHGVLFHAGYDHVEDFFHGSSFFLCIRGGIAYDVKNKDILPSIIIKFGVAFGGR